MSSPLGVMRSNRLFDTDAQGRPRQWRSYSLVAGQLRRYASASSAAFSACIKAVQRA
jgi:hypothetical protein